MGQGAGGEEPIIGVVEFKHPIQNVGNILPLCTAADLVQKGLQLLQIRAHIFHFGIRDNGRGVLGELGKQVGKQLQCSLGLGRDGEHQAEGQEQSDQ